jgi:hypothetical protein
MDDPDPLPCPNVVTGHAIKIMKIQIRFTMTPPEKKMGIWFDQAMQIQCHYGWSLPSAREMT